MPSNFVGLIVLLAALGPGYVFIVTRARRVPDVKTSDLRELVEMALIGSLCTVFAALPVSALYAWLADRVIGWPNGGALADRSGGVVGYVLESPWFLVGGLISIIAVLALACAVAYRLPAVLYRGHRPSIDPRGSAWRTVFGPEDQDKLVTVLMEDGTEIVGYARGFTVGQDDDRPRELLLGPPIAAKRDASSSLRPLSVDGLVVRDDQVRLMTVKYRRRPRSRQPITDEPSGR